MLYLVMLVSLEKHMSTVIQFTKLDIAFAWQIPFVMYVYQNNEVPNVGA